MLKHRNIEVLFPKNANEKYTSQRVYRVWVDNYIFDYSLKCIASQVRG